MTGMLYSGAPLHYVNIGAQLAGDYKFGYDTGRGPMGQSFREEERLIDGTIKGSYGIIDEFGHKRIVHYSAGKEGFVAEEDNYKPNSQLATMQLQPRLITQQNFNTPSQQFHVFKPSNYLQARTITPLYAAPVSEQPDESENRLPFPLDKKVDKVTRPFYRSSNPSQAVNVDVPLYRTSVPTQSHRASVPELQSSEFPVYRTTEPAPVQVLKTSAPVQRQKAKIPASNSFEVSQEQDKTVGSLQDIYTSLTRKGVTKKPGFPLENQKVQAKIIQTEEKSYDPRSEYDYYDSSSAFIDIERLSYNIGTNKN